MWFKQPSWRNNWDAFSSAVAEPMNAENHRGTAADGDGSALPIVSFVFALALDRAEPLQNVLKCHSESQCPPQLFPSPSAVLPRRRRRRHPSQRPTPHRYLIREDDATSGTHWGHCWLFRCVHPLESERSIIDDAPVALRTVSAAPSSFYAVELMTCGSAPNATATVSPCLTVSRSII